MKEDREISFFEHLEELRKRIIIAGVGVLLASVLLFLNPSLLFDEILLAPLRSSFLTYRILCHFKEIFGEGFCHMKDLHLLALSFETQVGAHVMGAIIGGFILASPLIMYELWAFVSPGLYPHERKAVLSIIMAFFPLFVAGILFCYFILLPFSLRFLINYSVSSMITTAPSLSSYMRIALLLLLLSGLSFELPVVMYVLVRSGFIARRTLTANRKTAFLIVLIISAIITPTTDGLTMLIIATPLYLLYEAGILASAFAEKKIGGESEKEETTKSRALENKG